MKIRKLLPVILGALCACAIGADAFARTNVLKVPGEFPTIQSAVDAAESGDIVKVSRGTYSEHVVIDKSDLRVKSARALIDGAAIGGTGIGIHVLDATNVEVSGFTVQNFERGIVLQNTSHSRVHGNVARTNTDKDSSDGIFNLADGIVLIDSDNNRVNGNSAHDNGHNGVFLINGSSNNIVRGNRTNNNGGQTGDAIAGCGIQLSGGDNNGNLVVENLARGNAWGILLGPGGEAVGNLIAQNRTHGNRRAGLAVRAGATANSFLQNNAAGNDVLSLPPSTPFDIFQDGVGGNIQLRNRGDANF